MQCYFRIWWLIIDYPPGNYRISYSNGFFLQSNERLPCTKKTVLNQLTDAMRKIDPAIWLRVALKNLDSFDRNVVIDSIRFADDYAYAREKDFRLWRITSPLHIRLSRLKRRGQEYDMISDEQHITETALEELPMDEIIENGFDSLSSLYEVIDQKLLSLVR